jgi:hypothetical protein
MATAEKDLIEVEQQFWQAMRDRDGDVVGRLTRDPSMLTGAQGVSTLDRKTLVSMVEDPNSTWELHDFELSDVQVQMLSDDVAVVVYKVKEEMTVDGKPTTVEAADSTTWVRNNGNWECAVHTEALLGDPFGRDRVQTGDAPLT